MEDYDSGCVPDDEIRERYMITGEGYEFFEDDSDADENEDF